MLKKILFIIILSQSIIYSAEEIEPAEKRILNEDLLEAVINNNIKRVDELLQKGADVNTKDNIKKWSVLGWASYKDLYNIAKLLLKNGAKVNEKFSDSMTPLIIAAYFGHDDIFEILLQAGADYKIKNNKGETAYDIAKKESYERTYDITKENYENIIRLLENWIKYQDYVKDWQEKSIEKIVEERNTPYDVARKIIKYAKPPKTFSQFATDIKPTNIYH